MKTIWLVEGWDVAARCWAYYVFSESKIVTCFESRKDALKHAKATGATRTRVVAYDRREAKA
jgi:hypothetical protein